MYHFAEGGSGQGSVGQRSDLCGLSLGKETGKISVRYVTSLKENFISVTSLDPLSKVTGVVGEVEYETRGLGSKVCPNRCTYLTTFSQGTRNLSLFGLRSYQLDWRDPEYRSRYFTC